ncbi:MAG TPA: hypothetical protein VIM16_13700 [Mucilaginibacter sp.]
MTLLEVSNSDFPGRKASGEIRQNNGGHVWWKGIANFCIQGLEATG